MLSKLQDLQKKAVLGGLDTFQIRAHYYHSDPDLGDEPDEFAISVGVWRLGDTDDEKDCYFVDFWESTDEAEWARRYDILVDFVSDFIKH